MLSTRVITAAVLAGLLVASPVAAQRQRNPGGGGGAPRGGAQGQGSRPVAGPQDRGGRPSAGPGRSVQQPRQYAAPSPQASRGYGSGYAVPRGQAYPNRGSENRGYPSPRPGNAGVAGPAPIAPRANAANPIPAYGVRPGYRPVDPGYGVRPGYRPVDPGYGVRPGYRPVDPAYGARPGYAAPRSYAVPRNYAAPRSYAVPRGTIPPRAFGPGFNSRGTHGYVRGYFGPPRYVAPGWRGPWGYAVLTPRFVYPSVISVGLWQPYFYRPSIGIGLVYGADGLYPFGAIPPAFYAPTTGVSYGGVRITDAPRDAQVFVNGNYAGIVDDFDGVGQHLNLEPGQHRIEIHAPGLVPVAFDVVVQPGQTITLRAEIY
jgi:hypothetical protein